MNQTSPACQSKILDTYESTDDVWKGAGYGINKVTKDSIFYNEFLVGGVNGDGNACFYNRKIKKSICMKKVEKMEKYYFAYGEWEGKWLLYQFRGTTAQGIRDLDCYCEKEGVCPFGE